MEDIYGIESGVTPMKSNFTPINYANVPYFILVGYELMEEEDFDFNLGFWLTVILKIMLQQDSGSWVIHLDRTRPK